MLSELRKMNLEGQSLEDLIAAEAVAKLVRGAFETRAADMPPWLDGKIRDLNREITRTMSDTLEKRLREVRAQKESLMTMSEKRAKAEAEEVALMAQLGK